MAHVMEMTEAECRRCLRSGVVGRLAYPTSRGPDIVPLNYSVVRDAVVFRTAPYSALAIEARNARVAFETDHLSFETQSGWSVVARGRCEPVSDVDDLRLINDEWPPRPWANGVRPLHFRVKWTQLTGRWLGRPTHEDDAEVHLSMST